MSLKIRMTRTGGVNESSFRIVATDARSPRDGKYIEALGWYDPKRTGVNYKLDLERLEYWKRNGAQFSDTVNSLWKKARKAAAAAAAAAEAAPATA